MQRVASPPTKPSGARRVGKPAQVAAGKARRAGGEAAMLPGGPREGACTAVWAGGGRGKAARLDACRTRGNGEDPAEATATVAIATAHHGAGAPSSAFRCPAPPRVPVRTRQSEVAPRRAPAFLYHSPLGLAGSGSCPCSESPDWPAAIHSRRRGGARFWIWHKRASATVSNRSEAACWLGRKKKKPNRVSFRSAGR